jgi:glycosyltransferase involved in cell wall biosynthesis
MQPPVFALICVIIGTLGRKCRIIADLHTGVFDDPKWIWARRITLWLIKVNNGLAIVTNNGLATYAKKYGVKTFVLNDVIDEWKQVPHLHEDAQSASKLQDIQEDYILFPLAYAHDEPLKEILKTAKLLRKHQFVLTGNPPSWFVKQASDNVYFTGYIPNHLYRSLVVSAKIICAITTKDFTMQRAAYEGLSAGVPIVTSNTSVLHEFYGNAAVFVNPTADDIAHGILYGIQHRDNLISKERSLYGKIVTRQESKLDQLRQIVLA